MTSTMNDYIPTIRRIVVPLTLSLQGLGVAMGVYGIMNPVAGAEAFGLPIDSEKSPAVPFISALAARNLTGGIAAVTLMSMGRRREVGLMTMVGVVTAMLDAWICDKHGATQGKARGHLIMGLIIPTLGATLYWVG